MSSPAFDAKDLLVAAGVGTFGATSGWSIRLNKEETSPDTHITLYDTGGLTPNPRWLLDYPSIQARIRGSTADPQAAKDKAKEIKDVLLGLVSQTVNGNRWVSVLGLGDIQQLGFDDKGRILFVVNFSLIFEPAVTGSENRVPL